jgi:hypothetical protein
MSLITNYKSFEKNTVSTFYWCNWQNFIISDVPEVFNDLKMLPAMDTVENLKSPLYDTDYLPHEKVFEWVITASSDNVVTLQVHVY